MTAIILLGGPAALLALGIALRASWREPRQSNKVVHVDFSTGRRRIANNIAETTRGGRRG